MQTLHRSLERLVGERTALINQLGAILSERGIVVPQGRRKLEQELAVVIDEKQSACLGARLVNRMQDTRARWKALDGRIGEFDEEFAAIVKANEDALFLLFIPGIGALIASALMRRLARARVSPRARDLAA